MKTSFYFVLWIILCLVIAINGNENIEVSVRVLLITTSIVACLYRIINTRSFIQTLMWFEGILGLENKDCIENSMPANKKGKSYSKLILAAYFILSAIFVTWFIFRQHFGRVWWSYSVWEALAIYMIIVCWTFVKPKKIFSVDSTLREEYSKEHKDGELPFTPLDFQLFQRVNMFFSVLSIILGLFGIGFGSWGFFEFLNYSDIIGGRYPWGAGLASVAYLYGSLALYFGIKDFVSSHRLVDKRKGWWKLILEWWFE